MKNRSRMSLLLIVVSFAHNLLSLADHRLPTSQALEQIKTILNNHENLHVGCEVYSLKHQKTLYSRQAHHLFVPASNTKLFTAILALELLGAFYTFKTHFATDTIQKNNLQTASSLIGDLYIKGSGDPSLTSADLEKAIKNISNQGIKTISGNIYIDLQEFDQDYFAPGSFIDNLGESWNNPVCACMVDRKPLGPISQNIVSFMDSARLQNMTFDITTFFNTLFLAHDITFSGQVQFEKCPEHHTVLYTHESVPVSTLISSMLKNSDNLYADCLFKKCGALQYKCPGTWHKGTATLNNFVQNKLTLTSYDFLVKDGSGRSRYNLISPHSIILLLNWVYKQPYFTEFMEQLSIVGIDGTLRNRMRELSPYVKAKTGTLAGVSSLSGYIQTSDDILAFSIITNGYISDSIANPPCKSAIENAICVILVNT